jgi:hypothetical protein
MPRKRLFLSSGGGISPGAPFGLNAFLFVQQASPPFAATDRLARLGDATSSIVAPGGGVASTLVLGRLANSRGQQKAIILGDTIAISGAAAPTNMDAIAIGGNWDAGAANPNQQNNILIGWDLVLATPDGNNVVIGNAAQLLTQGATNPGSVVVLGQGAIARGNSQVVIGSGAQGSNQDVVIGTNALVAGGLSQIVCIGDGAQVSASVAVAIGEASRADSRSVAIGKSARSRGTKSITIGTQADDGTFNQVIVIADNFTATQANTCWIGSTDLAIKTFVIEGGANFAVFEGAIRLLQAAAAPAANPASGFWIYTDPADQKLKVRGAAGTITTLANS